nr:ABC transporter substrate-binding protein [Microvirga antarctica]
MPLLGASPWAQGAVKARVGVIPVLGAAPLFVAEKEGYLKEGGLEIGVTTFESGPNMIQALASGTIDIYVAGVAPLAVARSKGIDVRVVAATAVAENVFVATPKLAKYFTPGTSPAAAFKAYRTAEGKPARVATQPPGSVPNTTLQYWLWETAKIEKADVEVISMGIDATQQAVLAGAVEGASIREPAVSIVMGRNPAIKLVALGDEMFPGQPGTVVAVAGAFADKNPAAVQTLVNALVRAAALIEAAPDRAAPAIEAALGKGIVDTATIRTALASPATRFIVDPRAIIEPARAMQSYQVKLGSLEKELPFDGLFDTRFYERALKGG